MSKKLLYVLLALVVLLSACGGARSALEQNRSLWQAQNIRHYRFVLQVGCFCPYRDPVSIEVLDGQVITVAPLGINPDPNVPEYYGQYDTIEDLFAYVENAIAEADEATIAYDPTYGFPAQISIDWIEMAIDDEMGITITGFEVLK